MTPPLDRRQLALIGAGCALSAIAFPWLTPYTTYNPRDLVGVTLIVAMLALAALVNYLIFQGIDRNGSSDEDMSSVLTIRKIGFRLTLFDIALHVLILANLAVGFELRSIVPARMVVVFFGVLLIGIGDLLGRARGPTWRSGSARRPRWRTAISGSACIASPGTPPSVSAPSSSWPAPSSEIRRCRK
jgi:hypothetical protein